MNAVNAESAENAESAGNAGNAEPMPAGQTVAELVAWARARLADSADSARLEAELLLADCTGLDRVRIMARPERAVAAAEAARFAARVARRRAGEPLAYLLGYREFYSLRLAVGPAVLVPRPETEHLVELALAQDPPPGARVLDLGTGSGAIALALASQRPDLAIVGVDRSAAALATAAGNGRRLGLAADWIESDWFAQLGGQRFDLIVCNPPYVTSQDPNFNAGLGYEPRLALDGGVTGLDAFDAILAAAPAHLRGGGRLLLEHGGDQREALIALAAEHGFELAAAARDLAGHPRAAAFVLTHGG